MNPMKRLRACGGAIILLVGLLWALNGAAQDHNALLWKIESDHAEASYLLGTIHSDDPRVLQIPAPVSEALKGSQSFSAELKMDMMTLLEAQQLMMLDGQRQLSDMLAAPAYQKVVDILARYGIPEMLVNRMKPWAAALAISMPVIKTPQVLDIVLYQQAQAQGKQLHGLETPQQQVAGLEALSDSDQIRFLEDAIRLHPHLQGHYEALLRTYLDRDLHGFKRIEMKLESYLHHPQLAQQLEQALVVERNRGMVGNMLPRLEEGKAFVAVGAAHLPGETGILQLLRKRGYRITPVY